MLEMILLTIIIVLFARGFIFDDSLENLAGIENKKISKDELYEYMTQNEYSKDQTYSQYLLGTNDLSIFNRTGSFEILKLENNILM